jgi:hypothetical protein
MLLALDGRFFGRTIYVLFISFDARDSGWAAPIYTRNLDPHILHVYVALRSARMAHRNMGMFFASPATRAGSRSRLRDTNAKSEDTENTRDERYEYEYEGPAGLNFFYNAIPLAIKGLLDHRIHAPPGPWRNARTPRTPALHGCRDPQCDDGACWSPTRLQLQSLLSNL